MNINLKPEEITALYSMVLFASAVNPQNQTFFRLCEKLHRASEEEKILEKYCEGRNCNDCVFYKTHSGYDAYCHGLSAEQIRTIIEREGLPE